MEWYLSRVQYQPPPIAWKWIIGDTTQPTEFDTDNTLIFRTKKNIPGETNDMGFRMDNDNIHSTNLILAIGDSFTYGDFVTREHAYPQQLADILASEGYAYTVVNAGINSFGPDQELELTRNLVTVDHIEPQIVIWQLFLNDLSDTVKHPLYIPLGRTMIKIPAWINSTYITKKITGIIPRYLAQYKTTSYLIYQFSQLNTASFAVGSNKKLYQQKKISFLLQEMDTLSRNNNFKVIIVLAPHRGVLRQNPEATAEYLFMKKLLEEQTDFPVIDMHQYIAQISEASVSAGISPNQPLFNSDEVESPNYPWKHLTKEGNTLLAQTVFTQLLRHNLLQKNRSTVPQP